MIPGNYFFPLVLVGAMLIVSAMGFQSPTRRRFSGSLSLPRTTATTTISTSLLNMVSNAPETEKGGYEPKWKKKKTLADEMGGLGYEQKGIKGTVSVVFQQGNETKTTMAMPGQPLRDVATQAGQFIKYGCGKGECGTCESMCNGKWIRPCMDVVPASMENGEEHLVIQIKQVANKSTSSGKFFSIKSFFKGFWNNFLGMVGFVKYRRNAKQNWNERQEYEDLIRQKTLEKKLQRQQQLNGASEGSNGKVGP